MTDQRSSISAATQAALWTLSNGRCYAPGCPFPVIHEVRPGVYKKNAQIAHIYGVRKPRKNSNLLPEQRESFSNLLLLCLAHHAEVDDVEYGEKLYPSEVLRRWKGERESGISEALTIVRVPDEEQFFSLLTSIFEPPIKRLESIATQLETTGTINATSLAELQQIVQLLRNSNGGVDAQTTMALANVADIFSSIRLDQTTTTLAGAADILSNLNLGDTAATLMRAADLIDNSPNISNRHDMY